MKNRKEKERKKSWIKYLNKRKDCVGSEPSALVYYRHSKVCSRSLCIRSNA